MLGQLPVALTRQGARFCRQSDGSIVPVFALALLPICGLIGAAVDYSRASNIRTGLQGSLDSAVLAGAQYGDSVALAVFNANFQPKGSTVATPNFNSNANGSYSGSVTAVVPMTFVGAVGVSSVNVGAKATAISLQRAPLCALALNPVTSGAFQVTGTGVFTAKGCAVQVNSTSANAISSTGTASAKADEFCVAGKGSGRFSPSPTTGCPAVADPLAGLVPPSVGSCMFTNMNVTTTTTLAPGVYCGGLSITGNVSITFSPGTYIVKDGPLNVSVSSNLNGAGVSFYLTGNNATTSWGGGGQIALSAPTTGPLAGILFFQDSLAAPGATSTLMADSSASYEGALYFPTQNLTLTGQGSGQDLPAAWTAIVANTIKTTGDGYYTLKYGSSRVPFPEGLKRRTVVLSQ